MRERNASPGGAVGLNAIGRLWRDDSLVNPKGPEMYFRGSTPFCTPVTLEARSLTSNLEGR